MRILLGLLLAASLVIAIDEAAYRKQIEAIFETAKVLFNSNNYAKALPLFKQLAQVFPDWADNEANIARCEIGTGKVEKGLKRFRKAVKRFPDEGNLHSSFCTAVAEIMNRIQDFPKGVNRDQLRIDAVTVCPRAVTLLPDDQGALQSYAAAMTLFVQYPASIAAYNLWLDRFSLSHPDRKPQTLLNLGSAYLRSGDTQKALEVATELMELSPTPQNIGFVGHIRSIGWPMDQIAAELKGRAIEQEVKELQIRDERICKPGQTWRLALNYTEEAVSHPELVTVTQLNPNTAYKVYGRSDDPIFVGPELPKQPHFYHERIINLIHIKEAFISGHPGIVHGDCTLYSGSHHIAVDLQTFPQSDDNVQIIKVPHRAVSIMNHQIGNYYHAIIESLPKLLFLLDHLLEKPGNEDIKILIPVPGSWKAVDEFLALPRFAALKSRYIHYENPSGRRYHFTKGLYLIDWIHHRDDQFGSVANSLWSVYWPPQESLRRVQSFFTSQTKPAATYADRTVVYISRTGIRNFPNEDELVKVLKERLGVDRVRIHRGTESLLEQAQMFSEARVVVGAHGAGLANYVHTRQFSALVQVPMDPQVEFCFSHLVAALEGRHYTVSSVPGSHYYGNYDVLRDVDIEAIVGTVERAWKEMEELELSSRHDEL
ncbi:hypothetical protein HDU79_004822 [Rhizoclosmatium sp. JEL0117]|nr:hypothetical protein HDU79_004822 [Rhizoclosmatium sp. JEL0117]